MHVNTYYWREMMKRFTTLLVLFLCCVFLCGCVGTAAVYMEKKQAANLPVVNYKLQANTISYSETGVYVADYRLKNLWFDTKISVDDLDLSGYVKEALAKKSGVVSDRQLALQSVIITGTETNAQFTTIWMGPWAKVNITAEVTTKEGKTRTVLGKGRCRMIADSIQVFTKEQIEQVVRNASEALAAAILNGRDSVEVGRKMNCMPEGKTSLTEGEVLLIR
jgi:hypothetical protein